MNIGLSVTIILARNDLTKRDLVDGLGVNPGTVSNLIKSKTCSGPMLLRLCEYFDIKASELIAEGEE